MQWKHGTGTRSFVHSEAASAVWKEEVRKRKADKCPAEESLGLCTCKIKTQWRVLDDVCV